MTERLDDMVALLTAAHEQRKSELGINRKARAAALLLTAGLIERVGRASYSLTARGRDARAEVLEIHARQQRDAARLRELLFTKVTPR